MNMHIYKKSCIYNNLNWFIENDYQIISFNNSWKLIPLHNIYLWFHLNDVNKFLFLFVLPPNKFQYTCRFVRWKGYSMVTYYCTVR